MCIPGLSSALSKAIGVRLTLKIVVALVLAYAAAIKIQTPVAFALDVSNYQLLPDALVQTVAYFVPALELVAAVALFRRESEAGAWLLSGGLFLTFAIAVGSAVFRGLDISCGCFGEALTVSWYHLVGNLIATALCLWAYNQSRSTGQP